MSDLKLTAHEQGQNLVVNYYQDVEPHLKQCHDERRADAEERTRFGSRGEMHKKMSVPNNVMLGVCQKLGIPFGDVFNPEYSQRIWAELKKPEYKLFRTTTDVKL